MTVLAIGPGLRDLETALGALGPVAPFDAERVQGFLRFVDRAPTVLADARVVSVAPDDIVLRIEEVNGYEGGIPVGRSYRVRLAGDFTAVDPAALEAGRADDLLAAIEDGGLTGSVTRLTVIETTGDVAETVLTVAVAPGRLTFGVDGLDVAAAGAFDDALPAFKEILDVLAGAGAGEALDLRGITYAVAGDVPFAIGVNRATVTIDRGASDLVIDGAFGAVGDLRVGDLLAILGGDLSALDGPLRTLRYTQDGVAGMDADVRAAGGSLADLVEALRVQRFEGLVNGLLGGIETVDTTALDVPVTIDLQTGEVRDAGGLLATADGLERVAASFVPSIGVALRDVDLLRIELDADQAIRLDVDPATEESVDLIIRVLDGTGEEVTSDWRVNPSFRFVAESAGVYYVGVSGWPNARYDPTIQDDGRDAHDPGPYRLSIMGENPGALQRVGVGEPGGTLSTAFDLGEILPTARLLIRAEIGDAQLETAFAFVHAAAGNGDDRVLGDARGNELSGGDGADFLRGRAGDDLLDGGSGADRMLGDEGDDTFVVDNPGDVVVERAGEGFDTVRASIGLLLPADVERLILVGDASVNAEGNVLDNRIIGNDAANRIAGGRGIDTLTGGGDADVFVFRGVRESRPGASADLITDFETDLDLIDLSEIDADRTRPGDQAFELVDGSFSGSPGELRWFIAGGRTVLLANVDADLAPELRIEIGGLIDVGESMFVL